MTYTNKSKAEKAAAKRSLFAYLNKSFSQFDVIEKDGKVTVTQSGQYPARPFSVIAQYHDGYRVD